MKSFLLISSYATKIIFRNWLLQLYFFLSVVLVILSLLATLGDHNISILPSYTPFWSSYHLNLYQIFPVFFLTGHLVSRERKDTVETLFIRPLSNFTYINGVACGAILVFIGLHFCCLLLSVLSGALLIQTGTSLSFHFFYWVSLVFPTLVFSIGATLLLYITIRKKIIAILISLFILYFALFFIPSTDYLLFDFSGNSLVSIISDISGYPDLSGFLLQRASWLLIGMGLLNLSVVFFHRLPNSRFKPNVQLSVAILLIVSGMFAGMLFVHSLNSDKRASYRAVYEMHSDKPKIVLQRYEIVYKQKQEKIYATCNILVKNSGQKRIDEILLFLNPSLKVHTVLSESSSLSFARNAQALIIEKSIMSGDSLLLNITYSGVIDPAICYLNVSDSVFQSIKTRTFFQPGNSYAFVSKNYTLLLPEVLWYPVAKSPSAASGCMDDFAQYTLTVYPEKNKTVISQGKKTIVNSANVFRTEVPLTGLSLIIGDYDTRSVLVDSVRYNVHVIRKHQDLLLPFEHMQDSLPLAIREIKNAVDNSMGRTYPFHSFSFVEAPLSFRSFPESLGSGSAFIQPEIVFVKERGISFASVDTKKAGPDKAIGQVLKDFVMINFVSKTNGKVSYYLSNLYFDFTYTTHHPEIPILGSILNSIITTQANDGVMPEKNKRGVISAIRYLMQHSLRDALNDKSLNINTLSEIFNLKIHSLLPLICVENNISYEQLKAFVKEYLDQHLFQEINFAQLNDYLLHRHHVDLNGIITQWYSETGLPSYWIQDISFTNTMKNHTRKASTILDFKMSNTGTSAGTISVILFEKSHPASSREIYHYLIKPDSIYHISITGSQLTDSYCIRYHVSYNYPTKYEGSHQTPPNVFTDDQSELICDNTDENFRIIPVKQVKKLKHKAMYTPQLSYNQSVIISSGQWKHILYDKAYGKQIHSFLIKKADKGESKLEWGIEIKKPGFYEVFSYIHTQGLNYFTSPANRKKVFYYYHVNHAEGSTCVEKEIKNETGWISLGKYYFYPGRYTVDLSSRSNHNSHCILGDAVKWVFIP